MNKVIAINLNGNAYQLEESGYEALRSYLDTAARRLEGNPDREEIIADIEQAIADKFRAILAAHKTVVATREVEGIIAEMGPVEDATASAGDSVPGASGAHGDPASGPAGQPAGSPRRLYKIADGAMIGGVCTGLAAYFKIDVTFFRIFFAILPFVTWGAGALLYILLMILLPSASTSAEKAAAYGAPFTTQEFIRRAKRGYYEGMRTFHDKRAHREWRRKFKQEMRGWKQEFKREMHEHAGAWRRNWNEPWAGNPRPDFRPWIALSFLSMISGFLGLFWFIATVSLLTTGAIFGMALPHGIPLLVGLIALFIIWRILRWPIKAYRHACYYGAAYRHGYDGPLLFLVSSFTWLAFAAVVLWIANRYVPQVHEALLSLPPIVHQAADTVNAWLSRHS